MLKMARGYINYVRATSQEAKGIYQASMSNNKYRPGKRNYSWYRYSEHAAPGYDGFQMDRW